MRAFLFAAIAVGVISYGANYVLMTEGGFSAQEQATGDAVRLD